MKFHSFRSPFLLAVASVISSSNVLHGGTVTTTADMGAGSLRDLVAAAAIGETIDFAPNLDGATITLTSGQIILQAREMTIDASALPSGIVLSGNENSRLLLAYSNTKLTLKKLTLTKGREVGQSGGALYMDGGKLTMTDCAINGCYAENNGGAMVVGNGTEVTMDRCSFQGNEAVDYGGAIFLFGTSSMTVSNTVITGNRSFNGGGIVNLTDNPILTNCTIQGNAGEGIRNENASKPVLQNTIVWGNRAAGGSIVSQQIHDAGSGSSTTVNQCLVENGTLPVGYPKFIAAGDATSAPTSGADLRVFPDSPVLDAGNNALNSKVQDRAGRVRVQNGTIDLGAFESGYVTFPFLHPALLPTGDENHNGVSNFTEYALGRDPGALGFPATLPSVSQSGGFTYLKLTQRSNAADLTTSWQTSTDLTAPSWQPMKLGVDYSNPVSSAPNTYQEELILKLSGTSAAKFYRQAFFLR